MTPAAFTFMDALPLTTNGKLDRKALPSLEASGSAATYVAPRNPIEQTLADVWAKVLKRERVGIYDNFFELGGNSLTATLLMSRIKRGERRLLA